MSDRSTTHATFTVERTYDATPARVFAAWADQQAKAQWFGPGDGHTLDFREGGREHLTVRAGDGSVYTVESRYHDIVPNERIVHSYEMHRDADRISVSVATVELRPDGERTQLRMTEQGVFLDGHDDPQARERGTREFLEALGRALAAGAPDEAR
ncbi:MAG TPA: SRPBCC family protein [Solirubrobacteraceae bacterium]|jgi:uncharacterized protein YndB with AHSA1/START domain|nr:SRPBCC family protein [Solirubrobacteraceae bacterium]